MIITTIINNNNSDMIFTEIVTRRNKTFSIVLKKQNQNLEKIFPKKIDE